MLLPTFYGGGHLKILQTQNAQGHVISFPLVRKKKFTVITDFSSFAEISVFSGSSGEYRIGHYFKCVMYEGKGLLGILYIISLLIYKLFKA